MIDDDEDDYLIISDLLAELNGSFTLDWVSSYDKGLEATRSGGYDLFMVDNLLGPQKGVDLIREASSFGCDKPMILLTGAGDKLLDIEALKVGAADYLVKSSLNTDRLERSLRHCLQRYEYSRMYREQQRLFRQFFNTSFAPTFILNAGFELEEMNPAFQNKFGKRLQGNSLCAIFADAGNFESMKEYMSSGKRLENWSAMLLDNENNGMESLINISSYSSEYNDKVHYFGVVNDITQLRKAEKELALAEQVNMTGRMARIMAHEIRNPLTNINLAADQLREELEEQNSDDENLAFVDLIKRNSERINNLITDLLNTTRETKIKKEEQDLSHIIRDSLDLIRDRIILKKITLNDQELSEGLRLALDAERLKIAFLNIFTNAVEAMEESETRQLRVVMKRNDKGVTIRISDSGAGMSEEVRKRIFEPFYTGRPGGMGLGMTAVINILTAHNAGIQVESETGKGTCFIITFPNETL